MRNVPDTTTLSEVEIEQSLADRGCLYTESRGLHFVGISGKHLSGYCNIDPALPDTRFIGRLTAQLVEPFADDSPDTVLVPAIGAIPLAQWGPYYLEKLTGKRVLGVWADKIKPRGFVIDRGGFREAIVGKQVLILEDMINQMFSVRELHRMVRELGGEIVGVGAIIANRGVTAEKIGADKYVRLCEFSYDTWEPDDCQLCRQNVPIVTNPALGHGYEFQELHPDYAGGYAAQV